MFKRGPLREPLKDNFFKRRTEVEPSFVHSIMTEFMVSVDEMDMFGRHKLVTHTAEQLDEETR